MNATGPDNDDDYDDSDIGCVNCEEGFVMCCVDDLCRGAGWCLSGKNDKSCWKACSICKK